jgi:hypothetical protein
MHVRSSTDNSRLPRQQLMGWITCSPAHLHNEHDNVVHILVVVLLRHQVHGALQCIAPMSACSAVQHARTEYAHF